MDTSIFNIYRLFIKNRNMNKEISVGVIGAGVMGVGVALDFALNNCNVILKDISENALLNAKQKLGSELRLVKMMKQEFAHVSTEHVLAKITFTKEWEDFKKLDIIVENITENWNTKKSLYTELKNEKIEWEIFAVNTSCISITKIAGEFEKSENVIGLHFMNPVPLKNIVEVVKGYHTSKDTIDKAEKILKLLNKKAIVVEDFPGFVANRLSHLFMNEAAFLVQDQVASPDKIDEIFKRGYGHKMGPLETADLIGLDTVVNSLDVLYEEYQDPKFRCCPLLKKMVYAGDYGKKTGKGFYKY